MCYSINLINSLSKALIGIILSVTLIGCSKEKKEFVDIPFDGETVPSIATDSVTELISDSGMIRYKLLADRWLIFDHSSDPHWYFPEGLYLEQFDTAFRIQLTLKADTVWNYTERKLWKLKGNVFIRNNKNETFAGDELFWNERNRKFHSDKYIEINKPGELLLKGHGFESNQEMTEYRIFRPFSSDFFFSDEDGVSFKTDSLQTIPQK